MAPESQRATAISLFSGAGGMDVGFQNAGFNVVMANDIDPVACETYRLNHGGRIFQGGLEDLMPLFRHVTGVDLVFGGPPCQGFSVAGKMDPADPRSELIRRFLDVVRTTKPRAFVCENVKALAVLSRWRDVREELKREAYNLGYSVTLKVLNSSDFGVPQGRERMFLIGVLRGVLGGDSEQLETVISSSLEGLKEPHVSIGDIVRNLGRAGSAGNRRACKAKITFAKHPVLRRSPYAGMLFNGAGRPLPPNGHSSTLPASMGGNKTPIVDENAIFHRSESFVEKYHEHLIAGGTPRSGEAPRHLRRLTIDECLAIQTFPVGYRLAGPQSAMYRQIGNAVPCKLAEAVATAVIQALIASSASSETSVKPRLLAVG